MSFLQLERTGLKSKFEFKKKIKNLRKMGRLTSEILDLYKINNLEIFSKILMPGIHLQRQ